MIQFNERSNQVEQEEKNDIYSHLSIIYVQLVLFVYTKMETSLISNLGGGQQGYGKAD